MLPLHLASVERKLAIVTKVRGNRRCQTEVAVSEMEQSGQTVVLLNAENLCRLRNVADWKSHGSNVASMIVVRPLGRI